MRNEYEFKEFFYRNKMESLIEEQTELREQLLTKHENELKGMQEDNQNKDLQYTKSLEATN